MVLRNALRPWEAASVAQVHLQALVQAAHAELDDGLQELASAFQAPESRER